MRGIDVIQDYLEILYKENQNTFKEIAQKFNLYIEPEKVELLSDLKKVRDHVSLITKEIEQIFQKKQLDIDSYVDNIISNKFGLTSSDLSVFSFEAKIIALQSTKLSEEEDEVISIFRNIIEKGLMSCSDDLRKKIESQVKKIHKLKEENISIETIQKEAKETKPTKTTLTSYSPVYEVIGGLSLATISLITIGVIMEKLIKSSILAKTTSAVGGFVIGFFITKKLIKYLKNKS